MEDDKEPEVDITIVELKEELEKRQRQVAVLVAALEGTNKAKLVQDQLIEQYREIILNLSRGIAK